ncbi:MAG: hypothetical protein WC757_03330 [Candidatus Paceibacterota bacterium]
MTTESLSLTVESTETIGPNLINNPGIETVGTSPSLPQGWNKGGYGTNARALSYPVPGYNSSKGIQVTISSYTSGDAKWYFTDVPITAGREYQLSDYYTSNIPSLFTIRYTLNNGTFVYTDLESFPAASSWRQASVRFTAPANAVSMTLFHLIEGAGTLVTDEYALNEITQTTIPPDPVDPSNLISNANFETAGTNNNPQGWNRGRWGTNTAVFSYPTVGVNGSKGAKVSLTSYTSGDAKWYFRSNTNK